jgi:hypothetical protein
MLAIDMISIEFHADPQGNPAAFFKFSMKDEPTVLETTLTLVVPWTGDLTVAQEEISKALVKLGQDFSAKVAPQP